jgi:hypothetical protein
MSALEETDTRDYRRLIQKLATNQLNQRIPNGMPAHAAILFETMFQTAKEDVRIFTGDLNPKAYASPELGKAANAFVAAPRHRLHILLQHPQDASWLTRQALVECLLSNGRLPENFQVRCATGPYATSARHFAVMDQCGYRYETNHDECKAFANFNEPEVATMLAASFDVAFAAAKPLTLQ